MPLALALRVADKGIEVRAEIRESQVVEVRSALIAACGRNLLCVCR